MSFKPYPKYKESGVEWLGRVPEHWEVRRLKRLCRVFPSNVDKKTVEGEAPVLLCNYTDVYYNDRIVAGMEFMPATATDDQIAKFTLRAGDTIITKDSETADDIAVAAFVPHDLPGVVCGYHLSMVRPRERINGAFVKRLFDSAYSKACFAVRANGLTRVGLSQYELDNVDMPVPPPLEQAGIATFLDHETAKIDALIAEQQRLIELLQEKRQAVISHAVTKGLNPDAPMKDSGIEWLGDVPEHWEVMRIRHLVQQDRRVTYGIVQPGEPQPDGTFMVRGKDYSDGWCDPAEIFRVTSAIEVPYARSRIRTGDLVMTIVGAGVGNVAVVPEWLDGANITQTTARIALDASKAWPDYVCGALQVIVGKRNLDCFVYGSAQPRLNIEHVDSYAMAVPPIDEQKAIARWVTDHGKGFDQLAAESKMSIALLQERRSALISAAVTGQIDVRDFAPDGDSEAA